MKSKFSLFAIITIVVTTFWGMQRYDGRRIPKDQFVIDWDVTNYYYYLPAYLIYDDPGAEKTWNGLRLGYYNGAHGSPGKPIQGKMTMGMAYLYLPYFGAAHVYASLSPTDLPNGFSRPYQDALVYGGYITFLLDYFF